MATKGPTQKPLAEWASSQEKIANISELHRISGLDRATVKGRLEKAGLKPRRTYKKETFYDLTEAMTVLNRSEPDSIGIHKARAQKLSVSTARELLKLQQERGELVPIADVKEHAYEFIKAMHGRFIRYARESKTRLRKIQTAAEFERTMTADFSLIFDDLKRDYPEIF